MLIYIGANTENLSEAQKWLLAPGVSEAFARVVAWAVEKETKEHWGECALFVEVVCRCRQPDEQHPQIDLLISFGNRIAICEVKKGPVPDTKKIMAGVSQVGNQRMIVQRRLRENGFDLKPPPAVILFFPLLKESEVRQVNKILNNQGAWHVRAAGAVEGPLDLVAVLNNRLAEAQWTPSSGHDPLTEVVERRVISGSIERSRSLQQVLRYLRDHRAPTQALRQPLWHLASLRQGERADALSALNRTRFVEILGTEGIGKSAFIKELFVLDLQHEPRNVSLTHCYSEREILCRLYFEISGQPVTSLGEHELLGSIRTSDVSLWVSEYDAFSRSSLQAVLLKLIAYGTASPSNRLRVVIESRETVGVDGVPSITLGPLPDDAIASIVQAAPWEPQHPLEEIVSSAAGNPGLALVMSRSQFVADRVPLEASKQERFAPCFVLLDLALDDLDASMILVRQERGAQAAFMAIQASRKILESILVARGERPTVGATKETLSALVATVRTPHPTEESWDYLGQYAMEIAGELDRWVGPNGELTRYPAGSAVSFKDLVDRHPGVSFYPYIAAEVVIRAARLVNWGQFWFRSQAPWTVGFRGNQVCELCEPGMQQPRRPMYVCGVCAKWVCESCSLLFPLQNEISDGTHDDRICDDCHKKLAPEEDYSWWDSIREQLVKEGILHDDPEKDYEFKDEKDWSFRDDTPPDDELGSTPHDESDE